MKAALIEAVKGIVQFDNPHGAHGCTRWAKAARPGVKLTLGLERLKPVSKEFTLTTDWQEYQMAGRAPEDFSAAEVFMKIEGPGLAWFDMLQTVVEDKKKK